MRKFIKIVIVGGFAVMLLIFFMAAISEYVPILKWVTGAAALVYMGCTMFASIQLNDSGLDRDWFKTQEELQNALEEAKTSWKKAEALTKIIGNHEAIRMWNEEQAKKEENKNE